MFFAIVGANKHCKPSKGLKGKCPYCEEEVIAKCGQIKIHHWAHLSNSNCPYKENKGEWHRQWQEKFDENWQEVLLINQENGERNIADIKTPSGFVIEFQHSHIDIAEREAREKFYKDMIWVVNATARKTMLKYFTAKFKGQKDIEGFNIDNFEYDKFKTWYNSPVPVFYDLYGKEDGTEKTELQKYLYCVFPQDYTCYECRYVLPIEREVFVKLVKDEKLKEVLQITIEKIKVIQQKRREEIKRQEQEYYQEDLERKRQEEKQLKADEDLRKSKEADERIKAKNEEEIRKAKQFLQNEENKTKSNANTLEQLPKQTEDKKKLLNKLFDFVNKQDELVSHLKGNPSTRILIERKIKGEIKATHNFIRTNDYTSDAFIECSITTTLATCHDLKNCNIRNFLCCPKNGTKLNEYWKNIKKDKMFFNGKIEHSDKLVEFSGYPILKIVDKKQKCISVLCQNYLDGKKQNNYSLIHIIHDKDLYIHYQYYSTESIIIFLSIVCNNNDIKVEDIKIMDELHKNS